MQEDVMGGCRILIASDVRLYSEGIRQFLRDREAFHVFGVASNAADVIRVAESDRPDVILLDQALAGSLETLQEIRKRQPACRVIALGLPDEEAAMLKWAEAGVAGLVSRDASVDDLVCTIESAIRGDLHCSARIAGALLRSVASHSAVVPERRALLPLTSREIAIVELIADGLSNKEIANRLGIAVATVKNHIHNLLEKLRVRRRADAAACLRACDAPSGAGHSLGAVREPARTRI
jgi:two-component system, NarL family, nitrate/nitrite response regulator NarL